MGKKNDGAIFLELPETEEWKKLGLPKELGNNLKMVYQRKEKDKPCLLYTSPSPRDCS